MIIELPFTLTPPHPILGKVKALPNPETDFSILEKYRQLYDRYKNDGVIDVDNRIKHKSDFLLFRLQDVVTRLNGFVPPARQTSYWIVYVERGNGEKTVGPYRFPIKDHTIFIVPTRSIHSSKWFDLNCSGFVMMFSLDFFLNSPIPKSCIYGRRVLRATGKPYAYIDNIKGKQVFGIFESIERENRSDSSEKKEMITIKLLELLICCDRFFDEKSGDGDVFDSHPIIKKFAELLDKNYMRERNVKYYADILGAHPNHLNYLLKKHTCFNAKESINNRVLLESKQLLAHSALIIKEIAHQVGFDDPNNFSTYFQKYAGLSPISYRMEEFSGLRRGAT